MEINTPVILITLEGNVKDKVSKISYTKIASFEALRNETMVVVLVDLVTRKEQKELEKSVKEHYQKYGKVKTAIYLKDGIDFIQGISNN